MPDPDCEGREAGALWTAPNLYPETEAVFPLAVSTRWVEWPRRAPC